MLGGRLASPSTLLLFGAGYVGERVARLAVDQGFRVIATTSRDDRVQRLSSIGVTVLRFSGHATLKSHTAEELLPSVTHVLSTVPPSQGCDPVLEHCSSAFAAMPQLSWLGLLSDAAVYGEQAAEWVDETCDPRPASPAAALRVLIEQEWAALGAPLHVFRLASVYGPARGAHAVLRRGEAVAIEKEGFCESRVHVDDVARVLLASMAAPAPGVLNLVDDEPSPPADALRLAAQLLSLPPPPCVQYDEVEAQMSASARRYWGTRWKLRSRARERLGLELAYPSYREGLAAVLQEERAMQTDEGGGAPAGTPSKEEVEDLEALQRAFEKSFGITASDAPREASVQKEASPIDSKPRKASPIESKPRKDSPIAPAKEAPREEETAIASDEKQATTGESETIEQRLASKLAREVQADKKEVLAAWTVWSSGGKPWLKRSTETFQSSAISAEVAGKVFKEWDDSVYSCSPYILVDGSDLSIALRLADGEEAFARHVDGARRIEKKLSFYIKKKAK
ncbi:hypothetical protein AB1Y20_012507 [Prymnesium parvum]|uniref:NAD(P)-binding domain-containing protein n=1 Tax=Prymnesium parvum TaxID=97485 RepID=A0AB34IJM2_PRYPA